MERRWKTQAITMLSIAVIMLIGWIWAWSSKSDAMHNGNLGLIWFVLVVVVAASGLLALLRAEERKP